MSLVSAYGSVRSATASAVAWKGAVVRHSANIVGINSGPTLDWDTEDEDTNGFHDTVTNNSRLTIPTGIGISRVRLRTQVVLTTVSNQAAEIVVRIYKNGSVMDPEIQQSNKGNSLQVLPQRVCHCETPVLDVIDADYFEVIAFYSSTTDDDTLALESWFEIEVVE